MALIRKLLALLFRLFGHPIALSASEGTEVAGQALKIYVIELVGGPRDGELLYYHERAVTIYFQDKEVDDAVVTSFGSKRLNRVLRTLKYRQLHKMNGRYCYEFCGYV